MRRFFSSAFLFPSSVLIQSGLLSGIALLTGPFLGLMFCKIVGASDGFMSFVNRAGLKVELTAAGWGYAALTAAVLVLTMLISVVLDKETSIVSVKRKKSRSNKRSEEHTSELQSQR